MSDKNRWVSIYFILLPFIDLITSLLTRFTDVTLSLGMIVKGITLLLVIAYCFLFSKSKYKKSTIIYYSMLIFFALFYFITKKDIWSLGFFKIEIIKAFKYFYFPVLFLGLLNIFEDFKVDNKLIKKIFFINCITYTALLLIPYLTSTSFNSYYNYLYEGSNGWFYAANETGIIMTILLSSIYVLLDKNKKWKILLALPIMISLNLIGTKVSLLGLSCVVFLIIFKYIFGNKNKSYFLATVLFIFLMCCVIKSPTTNNFLLSVENNKPVYDNKEPLSNNKNEESNNEIIGSDEENNIEGSDNEKEQIEEKKYKYENISDITSNELIKSILNILLSGRANFFLKNYSVYIDSGITNIAFGLGWNDRPSIDYTFDRKLIEIDILDIVIHYGLVGFIIYFLPLIYLIFKIIINVKKWRIETLFYIGIMFLVLFASIFAGHILAAPAVSIYLILIMIIIDNLLNNKETRE